MYTLKWFIKKMCVKKSRSFLRCSYLRISFSKSCMNMEKNGDLFAGERVPCNLPEMYMQALSHLYVFGTYTSIRAT